jgi:hypothetical protein
MASTNDRLNSPSYSNEEDESVTRDQDRALIIWFCTDGGTLASLSTYLNNQKLTFGQRLTAKQKKRFSNRIQHLKRLWSPDKKTQFTTLLRLRRLDKLASEIEQDEVVPKYVLSRVFCGTPSTTSPVASSVSPVASSVTPVASSVTPLGPNTPRHIQFDTPREPSPPVIVSDTKTTMSHLLGGNKEKASSECIP